MWDFVVGKIMGVLIYYKKGVCVLIIYLIEFIFVIGSIGSIKQWKCFEGVFMQNFDGYNVIINILLVNDQNVLFLGGDNGLMSFWDWKSGYRFQVLDMMVQLGSLDVELGVMSFIFDYLGLRLICGEVDKISKFFFFDKMDERGFMC